MKVKGLLKKEEHQRQKRLLQEKALLKVCSINRCISQKERKFSLSSSALPLLLLDDDFPKKKKNSASIWQLRWMHLLQNIVFSIISFEEKTFVRTTTNFLWHLARISVMKLQFYSDPDPDTHCAST